MMWIVFGLLALLATCLNLILYFRGKDYTLAMALGLAFTALTMAAQYRMVAAWVKGKDWSALMDVVPAIEPGLWIGIIVSIFINVSPILLGAKKPK